MLTFARRYASSLAEAIGLRLALAEQSDALAAAVRHKSHFIAAASHDLRQPVHAMGMFLESLQQRGGDSGHDHVVGHLALSLRSLRGMLDNMLDLSRLDADAVRAQPQPLALAALLQRLADETAPLARQKGLRFTQRCDAVLVLADAALLERVLRNLLANALKYTASGGVALQARQRGSQVLLRVQDSGVGIRRQDFGRIFGEFIRLQPAGGDDGNGLGLGLAIVERATRLMGVALRLRSRPGRGSVFSLWLPLAPPGAMPSAAMPNGAAAALPAAQALLPARLVLVIDDDPAVAARHAGSAVKRRPA